MIFLRRNLGHFCVAVTSAPPVSCCFRIIHEWSRESSGPDDQWPLSSAHDEANFQGPMMVTGERAVQWNFTSALCSEPLGFAHWLGSLAIASLQVHRSFPP